MLAVVFISSKTTISAPLVRRNIITAFETEFKDY